MDWLEILIPIIIIAVYIFSGLRGRGGDSQSADPEPDSPEGREAAAERERVQAEIRERILERRREAENAFNQKKAEVEQVNQPASPPPVPPAARTQAREMRRPTNIPQAPDRPEMPGRPSDPTFSWSDSGNPFAKELAEKREQIAKTQRQADALRKKHGSGKPAQSSFPSGGSTERGKHSAGIFRGSVRETLLEPGAARKAIILGEVMGKPVSMRKNHGEHAA